jgi:CHAD domain-containing protein
MGSDRAGEIRRRFAQWLDAPTPGEEARRPLGDVVAERLRAAQRRVIADGRAIDADSPADDLHELRKRAKKLRYLVECFGGLMPEEPRKAFVKTLKGLQDNLGEHQDTEVHVTELHTIAHELADAPTDTILASVLTSASRSAGSPPDEVRRTFRGVRHCCHRPDRGPRRAMSS